MGRGLSICLHKLQHERKVVFVEYVLPLQCCTHLPTLSTLARLCQLDLAGCHARVCSSGWLHHICNLHCAAKTVAWSHASRDTAALLDEPREHTFDIVDHDPVKD